MVLDRAPVLFEGLGIFAVSPVCLSLRSSHHDLQPPPIPLSTAGSTATARLRAFFLVFSRYRNNRHDLVSLPASVALFAWYLPAQPVTAAIHRA